ncbi:hypothetical protein CYMTET_32860 [Cymbomonas tetramitiformis]|uniref:Uncharacterized protein n=1 Tax=Cymbomonas tetramitiformis TaxID=36881 RepID=A0AAE0FE68_9CHLO|nr:hypothetical protein CYMTET_38817 [Cymbomonas tetramitiformis]KAK3258085.1 hypothetical protein CYMTET_32860 [Cymbomonas tetramitiformis]
MQAYDLSLDGSDSDSESNRSEKITPLGLSETMSSEQEEFATPEADRATGMEGIQREEDATSKRTDKTHPQDSPPKRQKDKKHIQERGEPAGKGDQNLPAPPQGHRKPGGENLLHGQQVAPRPPGVSPAAAELIIQQPYPWGFATTTCWLPSKEVSDEVATREVAIVDKKQVLLDHHRGHIVQAIVEHVEKLTANTTALTGTDDIFDFHVPSRQWAPSTPGNPSSLLQWKRNGGGYTINYYAIFTEKAYDALAKAGKQTVRVLAGVDDAGRHISTSITVEERNAGVRHTEITQEVRGFHKTYQETGSAMGDAQASAQVGGKLESPRLTPPVTRKGSCPPPETGMGTDHLGLKPQPRKATEIEEADPILLA